MTIFKFFYVATSSNFMMKGVIPYTASARMPENADQNNSEYGHFYAVILMKQGKLFGKMQYLSLSGALI